MAVTYEGLMACKSEGKEFTYTDRETMLYAVGLGMGSDPMDRKELDFCYERNLKAMPSQATVIAWNDGVLGNSGLERNVRSKRRLFEIHRESPTFERARSLPASVIAP